MNRGKPNGLASHPIPPKVPDFVLQRFKTQYEEIVKAAEKSLAQSQQAKTDRRGRGKKPIKILVMRDMSKGEAVTLPSQIEAEPKTVYQAISAISLIMALSNSMEAKTALKEGRIEEFYTHLLKAERSLGAATALSSLKKVESAMQSVKADLSHTTRTHAKKKRVLDYYRNNVDQTLSAAKAAGKVYDWHQMNSGESIEYRTIHEWILAERKKAARSSKASKSSPSRCT